MNKPTKPIIPPIQSESIPKCNFCIHYGCRNHNAASLEGLVVKHCGAFQYNTKRDYPIKLHIN